MAKFKAKSNMGFNVKRPSASRRTFSITPYLKEDGKKVPQPVLKDERIQAINANFKQGLYSLPIASQKIDDIKREYQEIVRKLNPAYQYNGGNFSIVQNYIKTRYRNSKNDADSIRSIKDDLLRSIRAIGNISLDSANIDDIQDVVDELNDGTVEGCKKQRRVCDRLNTLLRFCDRSDRVAKVKEIRSKLLFLEEDEVEAVLEKIDDDPFFKCLVAIASYTGMRQGEIFGHTEDQWNGKTIDVVEQVKRDLTTDTPKREKTRSLLVLPQVEEYLKMFYEFDEEYKESRRKIKFASKLRSYIFKAFPRKKKFAKFTFHNLRHTYAVWLRRKGMSTETIADLIGDSPKVCKTNYLGFHRSRNEIDELADRFLD